MKRVPFDNDDDPKANDPMTLSVSTFNFRRYHGFSLIELLVVLGVIGILAAIAIPSYQQYIVRSKQAGAKAVLLQVAQKQPQYLVDRRSAYAPNLATLSVSVPSDIAALFTFSITLNSPPPTYVAVATPVDSGAGTAVFRIDQSGARTVDSDGNGVFEGVW